MRVIGYGICGPGEAKKYLRQTLDEFKRLCDETIILCNHAGEDERSLISSYGFKIAQDDREWGKTQNLIKEDFMKEVAKLHPDWCICLDMDEVFESRFNRQELEKLTHDGWAFHFYFVNLWGGGFNRKRGFWNVRMWKFTDDWKFENRPLHPGLAPKWAYGINQYAPFVVIHYGLKERADRQAKIKRYEKYDPKAKYRSREYYESLKEDGFESLDIDKIHEEVAAYVNKFKPIIKRQPLMQPKKEYVVMRRLNTRTGEEVTFDIEKQDIPLYLKQSIGNLRFDVVGDVHLVAEEIEKLFDEPEKPKKKK